MVSLKQQSCKTPGGPRLKNVPIAPAGSPPPKKKAKTTQEVSDCASAGLVGLINWLMIAPFLITRVDSENGVDNWIREISPRASQMAGLIRRFLAWQDRKQPFRIPRWQKVFFWSLVPLHMVPYRAASCQQTCMNCVALPSSDEESRSSLLQMGRKTIHRGLWYVKLWIAHILCICLFAFHIFLCFITAVNGA